MSTFEERESIDYTMKKLEKIFESESFVIKDLDKFNVRIKKQEEKLKRIIQKIKNLEDRIRSLEREYIESSSDYYNKLYFLFFLE